MIARCTRGVQVLVAKDSRVEIFRYSADLSYLDS